MNIIRNFYEKKITFSAILFLLLIFVSCEQSKGEDRYSLKNILSASVEVIQKKGLFAFSVDEINNEIERRYSTPEDIFMPKTTIRQLNQDGSNNYRIIFEDRIAEDKAKSDRRYRDPLKHEIRNNEK